MEQILEKLAASGTVRSTELDIPPAELHGILLSLRSKETVSFVIEEKIARRVTEEGRKVMKEGTPEYQLLAAIPEGGANAEILKQHQEGSRHAFKNKWIKLNGEQVVRLVNAPDDPTINQLKNLDTIGEKEFTEVRRRGFAMQEKTNVYVITKGALFGQESEYCSELTVEMINNFDSKMKFKKYNFDTPGVFPNAGALHPLSKIREEVRMIFLEMGFTEMSTDRYVESSFWNFDSLFQPQNHPARDAHDTFFLTSPAVADLSRYDKDYVEEVGAVHSRGGHGSIGHQSDWSKNEAAKNILRTHTTSVSSRYLSKLAENFAPARLFSIDKVFRNESVDATHLAEFHQVEGLIAGTNLGLGDLIGTLKLFFEKLGLSDLKFKPAFNPYTEPSMEVFGFHQGLNKWIEIGNSGIFRPEMLGPMGFPEDACVIAWGLSLERPAMIKYGLNNIRELVGHKVDINFIKKSPVVQMDQ